MGHEHVFHLRRVADVALAAAVGWFKFGDYDSLV